MAHIDGAAAWIAMEKVAEALGLAGKQVRRIVLDLAVNDVFRAYVEQYVPAESLGELGPALAAVASQCAEVRVPPRKAPDASTAAQMALAVLEGDEAAARALADLIVNEPEAAFPK